MKTVSVFVFFLDFSRSQKFFLREIEPHFEFAIVFSPNIANCERLFFDT